MINIDDARIILAQCTTSEEAIKGVDYYNEDENSNIEDLGNLVIARAVELIRTSDDAIMVFKHADIDDLESDKAFEKVLSLCTEEEEFERVWNYLSDQFSLAIEKRKYIISMFQRMEELDLTF